MYNYNNKQESIPMEKKQGSISFLIVLCGCFLSVATLFGQQPTVVEQKNTQDIAPVTKIESTEIQKVAVPASVVKPAPTNALQEKTINDFCLRFINHLNANNYKSAYRSMMKFAVMEHIIERRVVGKVKDTISKIHSSGKCLGVEILQEKKAGNFAKKIICISKYTTSCLKFEFTFYSPASEDSWKLYDLTISDSIEDLFTPAN